jgi:hypothetical protein
MFAFSGAILLMSMRTGDLMGDPNALKKRIELLIFSSPVRLDR